jgi:hypothetical protein
MRLYGKRDISKMTDSIKSVEVLTANFFLSNGLAFEKTFFNYPQPENVRLIQIRKAKDVTIRAELKGRYFSSKYCAYTNSWSRYPAVMNALLDQIILFSEWGKNHRRLS